jgi:hypothetical protein
VASQPINPYESPVLVGPATMPQPPARPPFETALLGIVGGAGVLAGIEMILFFAFALWINGTLPLETALATFVVTLILVTMGFFLLRRAFRKTHVSP